MCDSCFLNTIIVFESLEAWNEAIRFKHLFQEIYSKKEKLKGGIKGTFRNVADKSEVLDSPYIAVTVTQRYLIWS